MPPQTRVNQADANPIVGSGELSRNLLDEATPTPSSCPSQCDPKYCPGCDSTYAKTHDCPEDLVRCDLCRGWVIRRLVQDHRDLYHSKPLPTTGASNFTLTLTVPAGSTSFRQPEVGIVSKWLDYLETIGAKGVWISSERETSRFASRFGGSNRRVYLRGSFGAPFVCLRQRSAHHLELSFARHPHNQTNVFCVRPLEFETEFMPVTLSNRSSRTIVFNLCDEHVVDFEMKFSKDCEDLYRVLWERLHDTSCRTSKWSDESLPFGYDLDDKDDEEDDDEDDDEIEEEKSRCEFGFPE